MRKTRCCSLSPQSRFPPRVLTHNTPSSRDTFLWAPAAKAAKGEMAVGAAEVDVAADAAEDEVVAKAANAAEVEVAH